MGYSDNFPSFDHWNFHSSAATDIHPWNSSESFKSHETEVFTKALQQQSMIISKASSQTTNDDHHPYLMTIKPDPSPTISSSDHERRNPAMMRSNGKITKRKSRATSSKATHNTTFITADPSNFRQMVQQVTGIRLGHGNSHVSINHQVLKPEPQRAYLPSSSHQQHLLGPTGGAASNTQLAAHDFSTEPMVMQQQGDVGLGFDTLQSFPTLESWRLM